MRGIKLRGYAVEERTGSQWIYGTGVHVVTFTDEYAKEKGVKEEVYLWTESGWIEVYKDSVGQYTDVKDENGKEIYEGDIVRIYELSISGEKEYCSKVEYIESGFLVHEPNDNQVLFDNQVPLACFHNPEGSCDPLFEIEVIGNIYEHPNLLEGDSNV